MAAMVQGSFTGNNNTWQLEVSADGSTGWMTVGGFWSPETGTNEAYVNGIIPEDWFYRLNTTGGSPTLHAWNECY
jgi:hypothetical protein